MFLPFSFCSVSLFKVRLEKLLLEATYNFFKSPESGAALRTSLKCTGFDLLTCKCKCFTGREMCTNLLESINLACFLDLLRLTATKLLVKLGLKKKAVKCWAQYNAVRMKIYCDHSKNTARKRHEHYRMNRSGIPKAKRHTVPSERENVRPTLALK